VKGCPNDKICAGDQYIAENPLINTGGIHSFIHSSFILYANFFFGAIGVQMGLVDVVCVVMPTLDRALCRWNLHYETGSQIQVCFSFVRSLLLHFLYLTLSSLTNPFSLSLLLFPSFYITS
jgi:hypothetical protein